jgi:hypothetical protein
MSKSQLKLSKLTDDMFTRNIKNTGKKYMFILKSVNTEKVDQRFGISIISNINIMVDKLPHNSTKISDLSINKNTPEVISFLDEAKKIHKCSISMIDFYTNNELNDNYNTYDCFWCRNKIPKNIIAIGCPIKYVPSQAVKSYYSEISKDKYVIKENITTSKQTKIGVSNDSRLDIIDRNYYITDGIFCSFNCCMAYITENKNNSLYSMSEMLLLKMYNDIYPSAVPCIEDAPHWRKLKQCGGDLTIEEFRASFNNIEYKDHGIIFDIPRFKSLGILFEEKLKF